MNFSGPWAKWHISRVNKKQNKAIYFNSYPQIKNGKNKKQQRQHSNMFFLCCVCNNECHFFFHLFSFFLARFHDTYQKVLCSNTILVYCEAWKSLFLVIENSIRWCCCSFFRSPEKYGKSEYILLSEHNCKKAELNFLA